MNMQTDVCVTVPRPSAVQCTTVSDKVESKVFRVCDQVPRENCIQVPREVTNYRSEQECKTVYKQQCSEVSREECTEGV